MLFNKDIIFYTYMYIYKMQKHANKFRIQDCCAHSTALKIRCLQKFGSSYLIFSNFELPLV